MTVPVVEITPTPHPVHAKTLQRLPDTSVTGSSTGIASVHAPGASDLILRNVNTGAFEVYANAGNGGRFDQVLCSACVVGPPQDFLKLWRAKKPLNRNLSEQNRKKNFLTKRDAH